MFDFLQNGEFFFFWKSVQSYESVETASVNPVESDLELTSRIFFDNLTLTLHNVTLTSQKPCQYINKSDAEKQTVINEEFIVVSFSIKFP